MIEQTNFPFQETNSGNSGFLWFIALIIALFLGLAIYIGIVNKEV